jgi:hypothetical protein
MRLCVNIVIGILLTLALTLLYEGKWRHRLFVAISFQVYATLTEFIVYAIFSFLPESIAETLMGNDAYGAICSKILLFILLNITILFFEMIICCY